MLDGGRNGGRIPLGGIKRSRRNAKIQILNGTKNVHIQ